jgi:hypothetical protein
MVGWYFARMSTEITSQSAGKALDTDFVPQRTSRHRMLKEAAIKVGSSQANPWRSLVLINRNHGTECLGRGCELLLNIMAPVFHGGYAFDPSSTGTASSSEGSLALSSGGKPASEQAAVERIAVPSPLDFVLQYLQTVSQRGVHFSRSPSRSLSLVAYKEDTDTAYKGNTITQRTSFEWHWSHVGLNRGPWSC